MQLDCTKIEKERIIKMSSLIEEILRKIWLVVICAIVFSVIFTGYKYSKDKSALKAANAIEKNETANTLTDEELQQVNNVLLLQDKLEDQQDYLEKSILMQINAYKENRVSFEFVVKGDTQEKQDALRSIEYYITNGALANDLEMSDVNEDADYLSELVSFESDSDELSVGDTEYIDIQSNANVFYISIIHKNADECAKLSEEVLKCVNEFQQQSIEKIGNYELQLIDTSQTVIVDNTLQSYQNAKISELSNLKNTIKDAKANLSDMQVSALDQEQVNNDQTSSNQVVNQSVHINKKFAAIGAVAGILIAMIIIALRYIVGGQINETIEIQNMFHLTVLGQIRESKENILVTVWKKIVGKRKELSVDEEKKIAFINIKEFCKKNQVSKILFAGSQSGVENSGWLVELVSMLKKENISCEIAGDFPYSSDSVEKLWKYDQIVLIESLKKTRYDELMNSIQKCMEQKKNIVGAIVVK